MDLSISIATTDQRDQLAACLDSIYRNTRRLTFEIAVVDGGSTDGTLSMLQERFPDVRVIRNPSFAGYGRSHNQAMRERQGRYSLILNDDMQVLASALDLMVQFMDENPQVGLLGCQLLNPDGSVQPSSYLEFPRLWTEALRFPRLRKFVHSVEHRFSPAGGSRLGTWDYYGRRNENDAQPSQVAHLMGACLLVRSEVIEQVGLFDETFFLSFEDQDWCKRIGESGWHVFFFPAAQMIHYGGQTVRQLSDRFAPIFLASRLHFQKKHFGPCSVLCLRFFWATVIAAKMLVALVSGPLVRGGRPDGSSPSWRRYVPLWQVVWSKATEVTDG